MNVRGFMFSLSLFHSPSFRLRGYVLLLVFFLTLFCFYPFFGSVWYVQDDYSNFLFDQSRSIFSSISGITSYLYDHQGRFQPVRLAVVTIFTHLFSEEHAFQYTFALHLINLLLLGVFLRLLRLEWGVVISSLILFSLFPKWRMIESPNAMVGGSGLNLFFILITFLGLLYSMRLEGSLRKWGYWVAVVAYASLVFSYEVAFPLLMPLCFLYISLLKEKEVERFSWRSVFLSRIFTPLFPFLLLLLVYLLVFYKTPDYAGAEIALGGETVQRMRSYFLYSLPFPSGEYLFLSGRAATGLLVYLLLAGGVGYRLKKRFFASGILSERKPLFALFVFSFYLASWMLFPLNHWGSADMVMFHHTYLISAASAVCFSSLFFFLAEVFPLRVRQLLTGAFLYLFLPVLIVAGINFHQVYAESSQYGKERTERIKNLRDGLLERLQAPEEYDAVIMKNFHFNYDIISYLNGALYRWVDFKKKLQTGRDIISFKEGQVRFRSPLSYDPQVDSKQITHVKNSRCLMVFRETVSGELRDYFPDVSLKTGEVSYQSYGVKTENSLPTPYSFDILLGKKREDRLKKLAGIEISFRPDAPFIGKVDALNISINDDQPTSIAWKENALFLGMPENAADAQTVALHIGSLLQEEVTNNIAHIHLKLMQE